MQLFLTKDQGTRLLGTFYGFCLVWHAQFRYFSSLLMSFIVEQCDKITLVLVCSCPVAAYIFIIALSCLPPASAQPIFEHVTVSFNCPGGLLSVAEKNNFFSWEQAHGLPLKENLKTSKWKKQKKKLTFHNQMLSLWWGQHKLPKLTVFWVTQVVYWVKFSTSNDHASAEPQRLQYCLCERMLVRFATSPVHLCGRGPTGW